MNNNSRNINIFGGIDKLDPNVSIPDTWASNSNRNIQDSQSKCVTIIYVYQIYIEILILATLLQYIAF